MLSNINAIDTPDKLVYCDFESQSAVNLRSVGSKVYITHPSTRIMSGVFMRGDTIVVWVPKDRLPPFGHDQCFPDKSKYPDKILNYVTDVTLPKTVQKWLSQGCTLVGHNAELFDAWLWDVHVKPRTVVKWIDTIHIARQVGLPGRLENLLQYVTGKGKADDAALKVLWQARIPKGGKGIVYPKGTPAVWRKMLTYNIQDVYDLDKLVSYIRELGVTDREAIDKSAEINQRGFRIDVPLLRTLKECWQIIQCESRDIVAELTDGKLSGKDLGSHQKVKAWLLSMGFQLPENSLNQQIVNKIIARPEDYLSGVDEAETVLATLIERQNAVRATVGKLDRIHAELDGDIIRLILIYFGAHTGRYSSRAIQAHNLPRGIKWKKGITPDLSTLLENLTVGNVKLAAERHKVKSSDILITMTRSLIIARPDKTLIPIDYSSVEARCVAWMADAKEMILTFMDHTKDIYCVMASKIYGREITKENSEERHVGKTTVLGCGYQMSWIKFGVTCDLQGVNLAAAGVTAKECVDSYRKGFPQIPKLWRSLQSACMSAVKNPLTRYKAGKCLFIYRSPFLEVHLPSGRVLRYRDAQIVFMPNPWGNKPPVIETVQYTNPHGIPKYLYGGLLTENISQGLCSDILKYHMVEFDSKLTPVVLHVHDEIVYESSDKTATKQLDRLGKGMSTPPVWAKGFPLGCEGFIGKHYTKGPIGKEKSKNYLDSRVVG